MADHHDTHCWVVFRKERGDEDSRNEVIGVVLELFEGIALAASLGEEDKYSYGYERSERFGRARGSWLGAHA